MPRSIPVIISLICSCLSGFSSVIYRPPSVCFPVVCEFCLPLPVHIMSDLRVIIGVYGRRRVEQRGENIGADVPNTRLILLQTLQNVQNMELIKFVKACPNLVSGHILPVDPDSRQSRPAGLGHDFQKIVNALHFVRMLNGQKTVINIFFDSFFLPVLIHRIRSAFRAGVSVKVKLPRRIDRFDIYKIIIILIIIIRVPKREVLKSRFETS